MGMMWCFAAHRHCFPSTGRVWEYCDRQLDEALEGGCVMFLRLQLERQSAVRFLIRECDCYGLDLDKLSSLPENVLIMHPGPINRGVELASDVADGPNSVILEQVTNGVAVRMAVLYLLGGGENA